MCLQLCLTGVRQYAPRGISNHYIYTLMVEMYTADSKMKKNPMVSKKSHETLENIAR